MSPKRKITKGYQDMTVAEKRVAIAKEALGLLERNAIKMDRKNWLFLPSMNEIEKPDTRCECCLNGVLLLSRLRISKPRHIEKMVKIPYIGTVATTFSQGIEEGLKRVFSVEQINLMEWTFSYTNMKGASMPDYIEEIPVGVQDRCIKFVKRAVGKQSDDTKDWPAEDRILGRAMLRNIIRNGGTFIP